MPPEERVEALASRMSSAQERLERLAADFVQHKESDLLLELEEATGRFYYSAPDRVLWEYESPNPMQVLIDGEEMVTWYEDLGRAERLAIGRYSERVMKYLGARASLEDLKEHFSLRVAFPEDPDEPYRIELTPRYRRIADHLESMTIWVHPELYVPEALRYREAGGGVTEYRFENIRINPELADGLFELDLPEDVEVTRVELGRGR